MNAHEIELEAMAKAMVESVTAIFKERGEVKFSKEAGLRKKTIVEYNGRMRADGMEKFNNPTFVSSINYYVTPKDMEKHSAVGTIIVYIEQDYVVDMLRLLKYPSADDENMDALCDCCGTLCNIIAGRFKSTLVAQGYIELEMSHFSSYRNTAPQGIEFCFKEYEKYEATFFINNIKRLVVEAAMGNVPKKK